MEAKRPKTVDDLMAWPDEHVEIDWAFVFGVAPEPSG
jgi:hypothetical protein